MPVYATRSVLGPYHVIEGRGGLTMCGLRVSNIHQEGLRVTLYIVKQKPEDGRLCQHCVRLTVQPARKEE